MIVHVVNLILFLFACTYVDGFRLQNAAVGRIVQRTRLDMAKDITMPALSSTMKEGKVVSWMKKVGDKVSAGDVLLVVESDKADMDVEAFDNGYLAAIHTPEGGIAAVGAALATLVDTAGEVGKVGSQSSAPAPVASTPAAASAPSAAQPVANTGPKPAFEQILMPALSSTMKEGKVVSWSKKVGDRISPGDMILVVESDKADMDVESYEEGYLAVIGVGDGQVAAVGKPLGFLAKSKEDIPAVQAYVSGAKGGDSSSVPVSGGQAVPAPAAQASAPAAQTSQPVSGDGRVAASGYAKKVAAEHQVDLRSVPPSRPDKYITAQDVTKAVAAGVVTETAYIPAPGVIHATPTARKLAAENNLDVRILKGTGNFGRVTADDVLRAAGKLPAAPAPAAPVQTAPSSASAPPAAQAAQPAAKTPSTVLNGPVPLSGIQKAVAKNMEKSLTVPVFHVTRDIVTDQFDALYAQLKPKGVTVSAMLAKAVAEVVSAKHPLMNAVYADGNIVYREDVNVAMAVALDGGLITPTISKAQKQDLFAISRAWKDLVERAKIKKLSPAEYSEGTIAISNLGMFGVTSFDAILPPNMGAILAISAAEPKVVQMPNGFFGVQKVMKVTVTADHRHLYGAHVAEFLRDLADLLENRVRDLTMG